MDFVRIDGRRADEMRKITIAKDYTKYAEGSVLYSQGDTVVLCNATVEDTVPPFLKDSGLGWVTAEYDMLPRATDRRNQRDIQKLKRNSRASEISRLIGRSLRMSVNRELLGPRTITVDCDVLQADGGTRTASICGGFLAIKLACERLLEKGMVAQNPVASMVTAVSVGMVEGKALLDLYYAEDSRAEVDMNVVMDENMNFIELQGCGERAGFPYAALEEMLALAKEGNLQIQGIIRNL